MKYKYAGPAKNTEKKVIVMRGSGQSSLFRDPYAIEKEIATENYKGKRAYENARYERERGIAVSETSEDLRKAYIAGKKASSALPRILLARGITGGAVASAQRDNKAQYEAMRKALEEERDKVLMKLSEDYFETGRKDRAGYLDKLNTIARRYKKALSTFE